MKVTIGKIAKEAGIQVGTIRYYETIGLLPEPFRDSSGYRKYSKNTVDRIHFIQNSQNLGFTLKEIKGLLDLLDSTEGIILQNGLCEKVREVAQKKINEIENKIKGLRKLKKSLNTLVEQCEVTKKNKKCPIMESLKNY